MLSRVLQSALHAPAGGLQPPGGSDEPLPRAAKRPAGPSQQSRCRLQDRLEEVGTERAGAGPVHLPHAGVQEPLTCMLSLSSLPDCSCLGRRRPSSQRKVFPEAIFGIS